MIKLITALLGVSIVLFFYFTSTALDQGRVLINGTVIEVEIVETVLQQQKGLSGRNELEENKGMLFTYSEPQTPSFWMKDMNFPIDIVWIDEQNKIVGIEKNINPDTYPQTFIPADPIVNVLEVNAGWSDSHNIKIGDLVEID